MLTIATVSTTNGAVYIKRLCKHFAHKIPASFNETQGQAAFAVGTCTMEATPSELVFRVEADDQASAERIHGIVVSHLQQFAHREELQINWHNEAEVVRE